MNARLRAFVVAATVSAAAAFAPTAAGHAYLDRSIPADGARLSDSPGQLRLWFTEDVSSRFRVVRILDANGRPIGPVALSGEGRLVVVDLPSLGKGRYGVYWRVISEDDGHATGGSLAFGVGENVGPASSKGGRADPFPSWRESVLRWLDFSFLAGLVGSLLVLTLVLPRSRWIAARMRSAAGARMLRLGAWCALLAAAAGMTRVVDEALRLPASAGGSRLDAAADLVLNTRWGWMWLVRELCLLAIAGFLFLVHSRPSLSHAARRRWVALAGLGAGVVAVVHAQTSHASSLEPASATAVAADAAHVLSAGAWLGSVAALTVALWPAGSFTRADSRLLARSYRGPFAECMALSVGVVLATGLYSAGREVVSVDGLLTTTYGHALLVKTSIVAAAGLLGTANFLLLRALGRRGGRIGRLAGSRTVLLAEVAVGAGIFLAAAALASSVPARGPEFAAPLPARVETRTVSVDDLLFNVSSTPTRAGSNAFNVLVASSRRPPPAPIEAVSIEVSREGERQAVPLAPIEPGRYVGWADLPEPGTWQLAVTAQRAGEQIRVPIVWSLGRADSARPVTYSTRELAPLLDVAAVLLLSLTLLAAAWMLAGRPWPRFAATGRPTAGSAGGDAS